MSNITITALDPIKIPLIQKLYKLHYPSAKAKRSELVYTAYCCSEVVGIVRLKRVDKWRLLTGMLVIPKYRGQGIGHMLLSYCQHNTLTEHDFCFAYQHLAPFYAQHGFSIAAQKEVPIALRSLFERYTNNGKALTLMRYTPTSITADK